MKDEYPIQGEGQDSFSLPLLVYRFWIQRFSYRNINVVFLAGPGRGSD
jgi:hypothetical protein